MVARIAAIIALSAATLSAAPEPPRDWADYQLGETVREDIYAPAQLIVINPQETAELKKRENARIPATYRHLTNSADVVEAEFRRAFQTARTNFLAALAGKYPNWPLNQKATDTPAFRQWVDGYAKTYPDFPVTRALGSMWAAGRPDRVVQAAYAASLREAMGAYIRPANLPEAMKSGAGARLVPSGSLEEEITLATAKAIGRSVARSNLMALNRARDGLTAALSGEPPPIQRHLASLVRPNCLPEENLTVQERAERTDPLWAADRYEPGQLIVGKGRIVTEQIKSALDQAREKSTVARLQQQRHDEAKRVAETSQVRNWIIGGLIAGLAGLFLALWRALRLRKTAHSLVPARVPELAGWGPGTVNVSVSAPVDAAPQGFLPHFARVLRDRVVRRLLDQRTDMLDTQQKAAAEMAELEARLEKVQAPLRDRLQAYEQRIADLEKELARKGEENRELIRAKILLTKQQLDAAKQQLELN
jgi:hypothetical protein